MKLGFFFNSPVITYISVSQVKTWQFFVYLISEISNSVIQSPELILNVIDSNRFFTLEIRLLEENNIRVNDLSDVLRELLH